MKPKKKAQKNAPELKALDLERAGAASAADCTGLIPSAPQSEAEMESYQAMYGFEAETGTKQKEE